ncbi:DUF6053 domain-containing protein [Lysobacter enzymogenes]|uniref:DUF6053 domain-containing protein n=1 Tax=Lysobacter enzymogenes TaxID=69 RepID=UPI003D18DE13
MGGPSGPMLFSQIAANQDKSLGLEGPPTTTRRPPKQRAGPRNTASDRRGQPAGRAPGAKLRPAGPGRYHQ